MKRRVFIPAMLAAIVVLAATQSLRAETGAKVEVPAGTQIQIEMKNTIQSGVAKPGDLVDFTVNQPVAVGGWIVIPSGAVAQGHVVSGGGYKATYNPLHPTTTEPIVLQADYVVSADGGKIKLDATPIEIKGATRRVLFNQATAPAIAAAGSIFTVKTDHLVHVVAKQRASNSGYDQ